MEPEVIKIIRRYKIDHGVDYGLLHRLGAILKALDIDMNLYGDKTYKYFEREYLQWQYRPKKHKPIYFRKKR